MIEKRGVKQPTTAFCFA